MNGHEDHLERLLADRERQGLGRTVADRPTLVAVARLLGHAVRVS